MNVVLFNLVFFILINNVIVLFNVNVVCDFINLKRRLLRHLRQANRFSRFVEHSGMVGVKSVVIFGSASRLGINVIVGINFIETVSICILGILRIGNHGGVLLEEHIGYLLSHNESILVGRQLQQNQIVVDLSENLSGSVAERLFLFGRGGSLFKFLPHRNKRCREALIIEVYPVALHNVVFNQGRIYLGHIYSVEGFVCNRCSKFLVSKKILSGGKVGNLCYVKHNLLFLNCLDWGLGIRQSLASSLDALAVAAKHGAIILVHNLSDNVCGKSLALILGKLILKRREIRFFLTVAAPVPGQYRPQVASLRSDPFHGLLCSDKSSDFSVPGDKVHSTLVFGFYRGVNRRSCLTGQDFELLHNGSLGKHIFCPKVGQALVIRLGYASEHISGNDAKFCTLEGLALRDSFFPLFNVGGKLLSHHPLKG